MALDPKKTYETERLVLHPFTAENMNKFKDDLFKLYKEPSFLQFLGEADYGKSPFSDDDIERRLNIYARSWEDESWGMYIATQKGTDQFVGRGGLRQSETNGQMSTSFLIGIMPEFFQQGFGTEIGLFCMKQGFDELGLDSIKSSTTTLNVPSQNLLRKLGFPVDNEIKYTGTVNGEKKEMAYLGGPISAEEFRKLHPEKNKANVVTTDLKRSYYHGA